MTGRPEYPGAPRWVKVVAIITVVLILVLLALLLLMDSDGHGPGRHLSLNGGTVVASGFAGG